MNEIQRKSSFNLTEQEKAKMKKEFEKWLNGRIKTEGQKPANLAEWAINNLYYWIGMLDYSIYRTAISEDFKQIAEGFASSQSANQDMPIQQMNNYLATRAYYSAMLQTFEEDIAQKGYTTLVSVNDGEVQEVLHVISKENLESSETIYHGTSADITSDEIGKKGADGIFYTKDGVSYFVRDAKKAERFAGADESKRKILEKEIPQGELCAKIRITNCATCFMYQEQLRELNREGVRYVLPVSRSRPEILNIENFDDFVSERDNAVNLYLETLGTRLPEKGENYSRYFDLLGLSEQDIKLPQNIMSTRVKEPDARYVEYDEMFPSLEHEIQSQEGDIKVQKEHRQQGGQLEEMDKLIAGAGITLHDIRLANRLTKELESADGRNGLVKENKNQNQYDRT